VSIQSEVVVFQEIREERPVTCSKPPPDWKLPGDEVSWVQLTAEPLSGIITPHHYRGALDIINVERYKGSFVLRVEWNAEKGGAGQVSSRASNKTEW
jgi:hypothetical protein